jgi:hypothetical protein
VCTRCECELLMTHRQYHSGRKRRSRRDHHRREQERLEALEEGDETTVEYTSGEDTDCEPEPEPPPRRRRWCCGICYAGCVRDLMEMCVALAALVWLINNYSEKHRWFDPSPPLPPAAPWAPPSARLRFPMAKHHSHMTDGIPWEAPATFAASTR